MRTKNKTVIRTEDYVLSDELKVQSNTVHKVVQYNIHYWVNL